MLQAKVYKSMLPQWCNMLRMGSNKAPKNLYNWLWKQIGSKTDHIFIDFDSLYF